jgi:hypothetical protein
MAVVAGVAAMIGSSVRADTKPGRDAKGSPVSFRQASLTPVSGYERMEVEGSTAYVAPRSIWSGGEVVSAQTRGSSLELTLTPDAAQRLNSLNPQGGDRLAIFVDGKLGSVGALKAASGRATISDLSAPYTERVVRLLNGIRPAPTPTPISASMSLVPVGMQGGAYVFDVFVQGVTNLRIFQVGLAVEGGTAGSLVREDIRTDKTRPDYVFHDMQVVGETDELGGRLVGVLFDGAIDRAEPGYLGTYIFRPSPDAAGTFSINLDTETKSYIADGNNERIAMLTGPDVVVTSGQAPTMRTSEK